MSTCMENNSLKKALKILMMNESSLSNLLESYKKQFKEPFLFDIKMNIKDKFPDNVQYTIQQYAAELFSHDMLDEIQHYHADKMLKRFHKQVIQKWLDTKLDAPGGYVDLIEYIFHEVNVSTRSIEFCIKQVIQKWLDTYFMLLNRKF